MHQSSNKSLIKNENGSVCINETNINEINGHSVDTPGKPLNEKHRNFFNTILNNYETDDQNMKAVIELLVTKTNIPHTEINFHKFINLIKKTQKVPDCAKILWELVSSHCDFKEFDLNKVPKIKTDQCDLSSFEIINHHLDPEDLKIRQELNNRSKTIDTPLSKVKNKWLSDSITKLSNYQTSDEELKSLINHLTTLVFPQSQTKFIKFINKLPNGEKYTSVLCDIIQEFKNSNSACSSSTWTEKVVNFLGNYETSDEGLRAAIKDLMRRQSIPAVESKFMNFVKTCPGIISQPGSGKMIWNLIAQLLPVSVDSAKNDVVDTEVATNNGKRKKRRISDEKPELKRMKRTDLVETHEDNESPVERATEPVQIGPSADTVIDCSDISQTKEGNMSGKSKKKKRTSKIDKTTKEDSVSEPVSSEAPVVAEGYKLRSRKPKSDKK